MMVHDSTLRALAGFPDEVLAEVYALAVGFAMDGSPIGAHIESWIEENHWSRIADWVTQ